MKSRFILPFIISSLIFSGCATQKAVLSEENNDAEEMKLEFQDGTPVITRESQFEGKDTILLSFAGDLMAHKPNWILGDFDKIYEDVAEDLRKSDFAFVNFETPVDNSKDYSTYPNFNVKNEYAEAAIRAGFNVFSLANNHTNDQGLDSIKATKAFFDAEHELTENSERTVYSAGLRSQSGDSFTYTVIEKNGWKILFMAITEVANRPSYVSWFDVVYPVEKKRAEFLEQVKKIREENPCDLFVLSLHCAEPEYVLSIQKTQEEWYKKLLSSGVDVVWANHPHVPKKWEVIFDSSENARKMIFYAQGNTISAQRFAVNFKDPSDVLEYTGDGFITQVRFEKTEDGVKIIQVNPILITTYVKTNGFCCIKKLDDTFISYLNEIDRKKWAEYLKKRKSLMEGIKGYITWQ